MVATTNNSKAHLYSDRPLIWHGFVLMLWLPLTLLAFHIHEALLFQTPSLLPLAQLDWLATLRWPLALSLMLIAGTLSYHYDYRVGRRLIRPFKQLQEKLLSSREIARTLNINKSDAVSNLHTLIDTLEQQVTLMRRQHQSMQDAIISAEQANSAKSEFLANMSHEIRTPLTAILGHLHLLSTSTLDDKQQLNVERITTAARILLDVINDILDLSRIESGKLELENVSFELQTVLSNMHAMLNLQAKNKGLSFSIEAPEDSLFLIGDPLRLSQILLNLGNNAIKFTDNGHVQLSISITPLDDRHCRLQFRISDTGIGMSQPEIERLFQTFSQADSSTTRRYGGSGLGLAICQQLVEQMGGSISVQSVPAEGSTFSFTITLPNGHQQDLVLPLDELQPPSASSLAGIRILLVEDNALLTEYQSTLLQGFGAELSCAEDGLAALEQLRTSQPFDIVLMDIQMPRMDGLTAAREIRKQYSAQQLPIIAMTAHALQSEVEKSLEAGMNAHLCKPVDAKLLLSTLLRFTRDKAAAPTEVPLPDISPTDTLPAHMRHFDLAAALANMGGKPSLLRKLLKKMQQEYRESADELDKLLLAGEHATALRLAHSLKGVAATLGATQLQSAAYALESALRDETEADHSALAEQLGTQLAACMTELDQLFATDEAVGGNKQSNSPITRADWETLITLLKARNIRASRHFADLKPHLAQIPALDIAEIDIAMQGLDYARALNLLRPLSKHLSF